MKKRKGLQIVGIAVIVLVVLLLVGVGIFLFKSLTKLDSIAITPDFSEQELDVNKDYTFTVTTSPDGKKMDSAEYVVDNLAATFSAMDGSEGKAILHTSGEGTVTICIRKSGVESNYLSFNIVDQAAAAAAAEAAEAEALAAAEAEAAAAETISENVAPEEVPEEAPATELIMTTDVVKIRATPSTDGEVLELCDIGDTFTRYEEVEDGWSKIDFEGKEAYIKSDYVKVVTEEEVEAAKEEAQKKKEEEAADAELVQETTDTSAADQAAADKAAADKAAADKAAADALAAQAAAAASPYVWTYQGVGFTQKEVDMFHSMWDYTGNYDEFVTHHTAGELVALCQAKGLR